MAKLLRFSNVAIFVNFSPSVTVLDPSVVMSSYKSFE